MITQTRASITDRITAGFYPVMEHFLSLQGEGFHQGRSAYFIRLAGCDVGCPWCDVKESWTVDDDQWVPVTDLVEAVSQSGAPIVIVTGGEPLIYDCGPLTEALHALDVDVHIETSGAYDLTGDWDWVCLSPKRNALPRGSALEAAHELKTVVFHRNDLRFAERFADKVSASCHLYLQPEWSVRDRMMPLIVHYINTHPKWRMSLQVHKYLGVR